MKDGLELFLLRDERGPLLYSPLRHLVARINEGAVYSTAKYLYDQPLSDDDKPIIEMLEKQGFFEKAVTNFESPKPPVQVTLFPSDGCNLRCRYCYAAAEKRRHKLPLEVAEAAVDYVAENAQKIGNKDFVVAFHGNGEPFTNFELIRDICIYTKEKAAELGIEGHTTIATNGVMPDEQLDWLLAWFDGVNISSDVLPDLQNHQRPLADGSGSYKLVDRTLKRLDDSGKSYGIRATLTADSVCRLKELALLAAERYPHCEIVHVEPAWECGRCLRTGETTPDTAEFIKQFLEAEAAMPKNGPRLVYSGARRENISNRFCAAGADSFVVTSEGLVTSCYEVCELSDPRAERFVYGHYDPEAKSFVFDQKKMETLHHLTVENMPECRDCFCKYHCAGDCPAKLLGLEPPENHHGSQRCQIARALTLRQITRMLENAEAVQEDMHEE